MRVLVTRPEEDGRTFAASLRALGHETVLAPLSTISATGATLPDLSGLQASIATSRNAVRHLTPSERSDVLLSAPLFAVGRTTAEAANDAGFTRVIEGPGTAQSLMPVLHESLAKTGGFILHLAGDPLALDVAEELRASGYAAERVTIYRARPATELPDDAIVALRSGKIDAAVMLSPLAVRTFLKLIAKYQLEVMARRIRYACLSRGVAEQLSPLQPVDSQVSCKPNSQELLALFA